MASPISSLLGSSNTSGTNGSSNSSAASAGGTPAPSEEVFLQLLVSQIQNQDPLNPTDSTQFVSQLAQFSELEQVIAIRGDTDTMASDMQTAAATSPTQASTNGTTQTNSTT